MAGESTQRTRAVQILAFDDMEVLDFAGPYEVFTVAGELSTASAFTVQTVGVTARPRGRGGFRIVPDFTLDDSPFADIVVIPGGAGTRKLIRDEQVLDWLRAKAAESELLLTVCTGALLAGSAGLLDGLDATTHHSAFAELESVAPASTAVRGTRFVRSSERIHTSAGVSAGIDLALDVVSTLGSQALREAVEVEMEWMWDNPWRTRSNQGS